MLRFHLYWTSKTPEGREAWRCQCNARDCIAAPTEDWRGGGAGHWPKVLIYYIRIHVLYIQTMSSVYYCETNIIEDNLFPACWQLLESDHKKECLTANLFILWGLKCLVTIRQIDFTIMEWVLHFILDFVNACRFSKNISGYIWYPVTLQIW